MVMMFAGALGAATRRWHAEAVGKMDFKSTYPSAVVAAGLCYTPTAEVLPPLMRRLIALRDEAKGLKEAAATEAETEMPRVTAAAATEEEELNPYCFRDN